MLKVKYRKACEFGVKRKEAHELRVKYQNFAAR